MKSCLNFITSLAKIMKIKIIKLKIKIVESNKLIKDTLDSTLLITQLLILMPRLNAANSKSKTF